jgi:hypothetical protein
LTKESKKNKDEDQILKDKKPRLWFQNKIKDKLKFDKETKNQNLKSKH